ncbi:MAG: pilus assembly protein [Ardenticatenaceae bacterium]|nr:pilus assembly protein [Ardenticatenaceae bacterium]
MRQTKQTQGQALVEFALIATVLLMIIFIIIEASHILWNWITIQSAAREGVRYAITGQFDPTCAVQSLPKYDYLCTPGGDFLRVASVISRTHTAMSGLNLNETSGIFEDDNYYLIEVWGAASNGTEYWSNFAGAPGRPVTVRIMRRVPILTPLLRPIVPSIPVFGQVTMNNENFGQQTNAGQQGQGLPPPLPPLPTAGVTPSPTNTPTSTPTNTPGATPTSTPSSTNTPTATPDICPIKFEGDAVEGWTSVFVTGDAGDTVRIVDLTTGAQLGTDIFIAVPNHACDGFADFSAPNTLNPPLVGGHVIMAENLDNGSFDTKIVQLGTSTPTPSLTPSPAPTSTPTYTPTPSPTATPTGPFIQLLPTCGNAPSATFNVVGGNWSDPTVFLYWYDPVTGSDTFIQSVSTSGGTFSVSWTRSVVDGNTYVVKAASSSQPYPGSVISKPLTAPCPTVPTPTPGPTNTPTPAPEDLLIVGPPVLVSTPPIVAYQPVQFSFTISNTGDVDIAQLFFVDLFIDPAMTPIPVPPGTISIPLSMSDGFTAISNMPGQSTRVVTITSPLGFTNSPENHVIQGMVDSVLQVNEDIETNNISAPLTVDYVTPANTPTPSPTPGGNDIDTISGIVRVRITNWVPAYRALVTLINGSSNPIASMYTDNNGFYQFTNVPAGTYTVTSCYELDGAFFFGNRTGITPPDPLVNIFMLQGACP